MKKTVIKFATAVLLIAGAVGTFEMYADGEEGKTVAKSAKIEPVLKGMVAGEKYEGAVRNFGSLGCLVVRCESRWKQISEELGKYSMEKIEIPADKIDFNKSMIVIFIRAGYNAEDDGMDVLPSEGNMTNIKITTVCGSRREALPIWHFTAWAIPKTESLSVDYPKNKWTVGSEGGDVVDGLQGTIEVEKTMIRPGEDIKLTFTLKLANAEQKESIYVWDNKYSNGYRNDAYIVETPDGKNVLLQRPEVMGWDKNAPSLMEIKAGSPWKLGGIGKGEVIVKSLKQLGLDTGKAGIYKIYGLYMESACKEKVRIGPDNGKEIMIWGGNISTSPVTVEIKE